MRKELAKFTAEDLSFRLVQGNTDADVELHAITDAENYETILVFHKVIFGPVELWTVNSEVGRLGAIQKIKDGQWDFVKAPNATFVSLNTDDRIQALQAVSVLHLKTFAPSEGGLTD